jgi:trigger factor
LDLTLKDLDNCRKVLEAELTVEDLLPHFEKAYEDSRKKISVPGFRKGKAPMNMIKKLYGESIEYSALEDITNEIFLKYIVDNKLDILDRGSITDMDYKPGEKMTFKVEFEVKPDIKVENYKGLELTKTNYVIDDSLVDDEINYHRFKNASHELDGVALDDDYFVTLDLQNLDEAGNILIGESQKGLKVYLGNPEIYPEFKEALSGIREGETKIIESKNAEGNPKKVEIKCTKVEKVVYPEMNEEFFKKVTGRDDIKTEAAFREEIGNELQKIYDNISDRALRNDAVNELLKLNDVPVPEKYVEAILNSYLEEEKSRYPKLKLPENFDENSFKKERKADAIRQAKWYLMREKLSELENIKIEDEDIKKFAEKNAERFNIPVEKLIDIYKKNEDVKLNIMNDKVLDMLLNNALLTEKEEIKKKDEKEHEIEKSKS